MPLINAPESATSPRRCRRKPRSRCTGPPLYAVPVPRCMWMPCARPISSRVISLGWLSTTPLALCFECSTRSTTDRAKFSSSICGTAMRNPGASSLTSPALCEVRWERNPRPVGRPSGLAEGGEQGGDPLRAFTPQGLQIRPRDALADRRRGSRGEEHLGPERGRVDEHRALIAAHRLQDGRADELQRRVGAAADEAHRAVRVREVLGQPGMEGHAVESGCAAGSAGARSRQLVAERGAELREGVGAFRSIGEGGIQVGKDQQRNLDRVRRQRLDLQHRARGRLRGLRERRAAPRPPAVEQDAPVQLARGAAEPRVGAHAQRLDEVAQPGVVAGQRRLGRGGHGTAAVLDATAQMPRRQDLKSILLLGSGPIVIGQACEFDYSGVQALKALREEGYRTILLNSNPATIMTDPEWADRTYIEPLTVEAAERVLAAERPDAVLPTLGGQTALNLAVRLAREGILAKYGSQLIGAQLDAIEKAEDRQRFKDTMTSIGVDVPKSGVARSLDEVAAIGIQLGFPLILRPSFTLGGLGGGIAYNRDELAELGARALSYSPTHEVLIEESVLGWKEFELEVMRDKADNVVIICSIENLDPMGVHTGDSITVAPAQTLSDFEYQAMRDLARQVIRAIGVETGGSNIQFGVHPKTGRIVVIEMNPRVSRSSALASKATGFPIAKIAAKLAVGYSLDEIKNDITRSTPSSFEPAIDYTVVKIPRFNFEKFPHADQTLTTSMKSVGEVMSIGRTFAQAMQKALRSLEQAYDGFASPTGRDRGPFAYSEAEKEEIRAQVKVPTPRRIFWLAEALRAGIAVDEIHALCAIDPWFIREIEGIVLAEKQLVAAAAALPAGGAVPDLPALKRLGFSDHRIGRLTGHSEDKVAQQRAREGLKPVFKRVDTCAAEFEANTPYLYSTYEDEDEVRPTSRKKVMILGSGPNRIGQGVEFDYCCVQASYALREAGYETIMVNCNPETVSTDYDTSDRLYFEPLTAEDVISLVRREQEAGRVLGCIVQYGGQTPLKLSQALSAAGIPILGTSPDAIDLAEDRSRFQQLLKTLGLKQPMNGIAYSVEQSRLVAADLG